MSTAPGRSSWFGSRSWVGPAVPRPPGGPGRQTDWGPGEVSSGRSVPAPQGPPPPLRWPVRAGSSSGGCDRPTCPGPPAACPRHRAPSPQSWRLLQTCCQGRSSYLNWTSWLPGPAQPEPLEPASPALAALEELLLLLPLLPAPGPGLLGASHFYVLHAGGGEGGEEGPCHPHHSLTQVVLASGGAPGQGGVTGQGGAGSLLVVADREVVQHGRGVEGWQGGRVVPVRAISSETISVM